MARINIEDCWWTDPRRERLSILVGSPLLADAVVIRAWRIAQEFWGNEQGLIPKHVFHTIEASSKLIEANLAEERKDGFYIRGSSQYLDWLVSRRRAAKAGGLKSAQERSKKAKQKETKVIQTQPSSSYSSSSSGSNSVSGSTYLQKPEKAKEKANRFIAAYCERFKLRWKTNPVIKGKEAGIAKRLTKEIPETKQELYLDAFFALPDAWLVKAKHPLSAFDLKLNEVSVFAETGNFHTQRQVRQADDSATNALLLAEIRREGK